MIAPQRRLKAINPWLSRAVRPISSVEYPFAQAQPMVDHMSR